LISATIFLPTFGAWLRWGTRILPEHSEIPLPFLLVMDH